MENSELEISLARSMALQSRFPVLTAPWMLLSLLTILLWGIWGLESKIIVDRISPWMNQVIFSVGLLPPLALMLRAKNLRVVNGNARRGAFFALFTGVLGGTGNLALYTSLAKNGQASVVLPLVGLAPLITVILALIWLKESLNRLQWLGVIVATVSIYLLSV
jgi:transporter family protein